MSLINHSVGQMSKFVSGETIREVKKFYGDPLDDFFFHTFFTLGKIEGDIDDGQQV